MWAQALAVRKREDEVFPRTAGIDIGASSHWVAVLRHLADDPVREFGAMTGELNAMADGMIACGVDTVALESTGVYRIVVYEVLEQRGLKVWLVDARQMKYVPGRKSDVQDCQLRISVIVDGETALSRTRRGGAQALGLNVCRRRHLEGVTPCWPCSHSCESSSR